MQHSKTVIQHSSVSRLSHHHNQLERSAERPLERSKHSRTCPISCGSLFCRYTLLPGLGCSTRSHTLIGFLKEEGIGPRALCLLLALLMDSVVHQGARTVMAFAAPAPPHFRAHKQLIFHLLVPPTTYWFTSFTTIAPPSTHSLPSWVRSHSVVFALCGSWARPECCLGTSGICFLMIPVMVLA